MIDRSSIQQILEEYEKLKERGHEIAKLLRFSADEIKLPNSWSHLESESFTIAWDDSSCRRGCCSPDIVTQRISLRYFWMSDAEILAEKIKVEADGYFND